MGTKLRGQVHLQQNTRSECLLRVFQEEFGAGGLLGTILGNVVLLNKHVDFFQCSQFVGAICWLLLH